MPGCLVLYDSIHHVLAAEERLKPRGLWYDLVPVPRELSSDCGIALAFHDADLPAVRELLSDPHLPPGRFYRGNREIAV